jgi:hypothetical protein
MSSAFDDLAEEAWRPLYRLGAIAAVAMVVLLPVAGAAFVLAPTPTDATSAFELFQRNPLLGLLSLDLTYMIEILLAGVLLLVLSVALRRVNPSLIALALFLDVTATAVYFASNPAFEMLTLSVRHAGAATDAERSMFFAAGEAMLATYTGTAFNSSYVMAGLAGLVIATVMLRSDVFGRTTARLGIVMGVLALVPPTIGKVGIFAAFIYLAPFAVWCVLIARRLSELGRELG